MTNQNQPYDVVVVGSGASGGWACKKLSEAGLNVALLDAGRPQSDANFVEHKPVFDLKYHNLSKDVLLRTHPIQMRMASEFNAHWFANDLDEPYTTAPGMPFVWAGRVRMVGGRTNVWGRQCYRLSDLDFKAGSHDGFGEDWPISYKDLAPYYDQVEGYVGVSGRAEGLAQLPDGNFHPHMALRCCEEQFRTRVKAKLGWTVTAGRTANITKPLNGRAPCHYCGPCDRGCVTHSYFNSAFTTVADAVNTGRCTLIPNAMAYQVLMDSDRNRARGVLYVDRETRQVREVAARAVILCAQATESVRILFNSANRQYPKGLANSSGVMGHYLMDHIAIGGGAHGEFSDFMETPSLNGPNRPNGIYVPRFQNVPGQPKSKKFIRGYGFQTWLDDRRPNLRADGYGAAYKKAIMTPEPAQITLKGFGECLAQWDNYMELDPNVKDTFGIPVVRFHVKYRENELAIIKDMGDTAAEMMEAAGARNIKPYAFLDRQPGLGIHEVGMARMGKDPKKSVLNEFQQAHDVKNLFVMDGAGFTSTACQNPTLTIMTLCARSCDNLMDEMKRGNI